MTPQEEAIALKEDPLPIVILPEEEFLPSAIYQVDLQISELSKQIHELQQQRERMIDRALEINILEDPFCRIEKKVRAVRVIIPEKFRAMFPKEYDLICEMERNNLQKEMEKVGGFIPVGVADKFVKKTDSRDCVDLKESVSYQVVKKEAD